MVIREKLFVNSIQNSVIIATNQEIKSYLDYFSNCSVEVRYYVVPIVNNERNISKASFKFPHPLIRD